MDSVDWKSIRETRGLSLRDVYEKTRISVNNIEAMESGDFGSLPPAVYARKFIRDYAALLGEDSSHLLEEYENYLTSLRPPVVDLVNRTGTEKEGYPGTAGHKPRGWILAFLAAGFILVLLGYLAISDYGKRLVEGGKIFNAAPPANGDNPRGQISNLSPRSVQPGGNAAIRKGAAASGQTPGGAYHLAIEARELTWLRIRSDQKPPQQLLMNPGERVERYADQYFILDIGNAGGVALSLQGAPLSSPGKSGEVVHLKLP